MTHTPFSSADPRKQIPCRRITASQLTSDRYAERQAIVGAGQKGLLDVFPAASTRAITY